MFFFPTLSSTPTPHPLTLSTWTTSDTSLPTVTMDGVLWVAVQGYDKVVYIPTVAIATKLISLLPPKVTLFGAEFEGNTAIAVQTLRVLMVIPLLLGVGLGFPLLSVVALVVHDVILAHASGLVAQQRKTKKHQDDDPLITFTSIFVGKVVNASGFVATLLSIRTLGFPFFDAAATVVILFTLTAYEVVDMGLRVVDFFPTRPSDQVGYARFGGAGGMVGFSIEAKIKEKLDSLGLATLLAASTFSFLRPLALVALAGLALSVYWAHGSLAHKFRVRTSTDSGRASALAKLERLKLQSPVHQDVSLDPAAQVTDAREPREFTTAYTVGCFDLFHDGHVRLLTRMREHAQRIVVGVHDDESIFRLKNRYPMDNTVKRIRNVKTYADVVWVIPSTNPTPYLDCIIDRSDAASSCYIRGADMPNFPGRELCEKLLTVKLLPYTEGVSSTKLRGELLERRSSSIPATESSSSSSSSSSLSVSGSWLRYNGKWIRSSEEWLRYGDIWVRYPSSLISKSDLDIDHDDDADHDHLD